MNHIEEYPQFLSILYLHEFKFLYKVILRHIVFLYHIFFDNINIFHKNIFLNSFYFVCNSVFKTKVYIVLLKVKYYKFVKHILIKKIFLTNLKKFFFK